MRDSWSDRVHALLGKHVRVTLSRPEGESPTVTEGILLGFGDGGDLELAGSDGLVYHCWPMLDIEEVASGA